MFVQILHTSRNLVFSFFLIFSASSYLWEFSFLPPFQYLALRCTHFCLSCSARLLSVFISFKGYSLSSISLLRTTLFWLRRSEFQFLYREKWNSFFPRPPLQTRSSCIFPVPSTTLQESAWCALSLSNINCGSIYLLLSNVATTHHNK